MSTFFVDGAVGSAELPCGMSKTSAALPFAALACALAVIGQAGHAVQVHDRPVDLLTDIDGVDFDAAWPNRESTIHDSLAIQFVALADLKANKRASGRPRDIDDLEQLP